MANAFDAVPHVRLIDACRTLLPIAMVEFIRSMSYTGKKKGIYQGSPASPLLWNIFCDHFIDRPFSRQMPSASLFRYADDILLVCALKGEADEALAKLTKIARTAGTALKPSATVSDIRAGDPVEWLGYTVRRNAKKLGISIGEPAWQKLHSNLQDAHHHPASPLRAISIVCGWLDYRGPCYVAGEVSETVARIRGIAESLSFDEIPSTLRLAEWWRQSHARCAN